MLIFLALPALWFLWSVQWGSPTELVVDSSGQISGYVNNLRVSAQGEKFWQQQLELVRREIDYLERAPQRAREMDAEMAQLERELMEWNQELYRDHPELRPSPAQIRAQQLRDEADRIEDQQFKAMIKRVEQESLSRLREIETIIIARLQ